MKVTAEILRYGAEKSGVSSSTGRQWMMRDVTIQWFDEGANGRYEQQTVMTASQPLDEKKLDEAIASRKQMDVTIYFGTREYDGRDYAKITGYLPKEFNRNED